MEAKSPAMRAGRAERQTRGPDQRRVPSSQEDCLEEVGFYLGPGVGVGRLGGWEGQDERGVRDGERLQRVW